MGQRRDQKRNQDIYEISENGNTTYQNLWEPSKAGLRGTFIEINAYIKKQERFQITSLYSSPQGRFVVHDQEEKVSYKEQYSFFSPLFSGKWRYLE